MTELAKGISEFGILIILAAVWLFSSIKRDQRESRRLETMEQSIAPAMLAVSEALENSAIEKRDLKDIVNNNTVAVERIVTLYQRSMDQLERDENFILALKDELQAHGVQQAEILRIVQKLEQKARA